MVGPAPNSLSNVVQRLVELDMVELDAPGPWPGEPGDDDVSCEIDWLQVQPTGHADEDREDDESKFISAMDPWGGA